MNNGLGFQLANVPTITGLASVNANDVTTDTIEVSTLTVNGVDIITTLDDKVSKTLGNTVTGINTFSNPANVFYGDGANLTGISSSTVTLSNTATGTTNYLVMSTTNSGTSSLLTDNSGAVYNSVTNTAFISITGTAGSVQVASTDAATIYYPLFSPGSAGAKLVFFDNVTSPFSYQPSTSTLTASIFSGTATNATNATNAANVNLTVDDTATTYYPTFAASGGGNKPLLYDTTSTPLSYEPSTSTLTASIFNGTVTNATNATNVNLTVDDTATTYYPIFAASGGGNKPLLYDTTTTPLSYDPSTSTLTASIFNGSITNATNATNVNLTVDNTATVYYPTFAASGAGNKPLLYDTTTTPLSYQPSTSTLTASIFSIPTTVASTISATGTTLNITNGNVGGANIITGLTNFISPNITIYGTSNFNVGHGAGSISNTCIGYGTPRTVVFTTGSNTFIGSSAGQNMDISADSNTYVGTQAGVGQTSGKYNTFFGAYAGNQVSGTGWRNTAIGNMALDSMITIAENNTAVGAEAGNQVSTGYNNTLIGWGAGGSITTGANCICIGALSAPSSGTAQNEIIIGSASDTMFIKGGLILRVGELITNSTNGNLVGLVLAQHYPVTMSAAGQTITLPNPTTAAYKGARVTFKRRTNTTSFTFTAAGTTPFLGTGSITPVASPTTIGAAIFQVDMICDGVNWCFISTV